MSDQGFDFQPPAQRRPPRRFEPPPWERDQFERHAQEQAERERQEREAEERAREEDALAAAAEKQDAERDDPAPTEVAQEAMREGNGEPEAPRQVDEAVVENLLLGLKAEETPTLSGLWAVAVWAGALLGLVGIAVGVWGTFVLLTPALGSRGKIGGMVLLMLGATFVGIGAWMGYRALRQQGVL